MSLQVWLPLNGDLHNQGLSGLTVTNNGATVDNNGKIGKCYSFNGSSARISLSAKTFTYPLSTCAWIKCNNATDSNTEYIFSYNTDSGGTSGHNIGFGIYQGKLSIWHGGAVTQYGTALSNGIWYHVTVVVTSTGYKAYLNGAEILTATATQTNANSKWITLGARSNSTTGGVGGALYYFNGYMNDARFYDHALSPKEVEEIAKGLVLHYKLDDRFCEPTTNLVSQLVAGGRTTVINNIVKNTGENADTYWYLKPKEALEGGSTYTVSCYCTGFSSPDTFISFGVGAQSGANNAGTWKIYNGYNAFTFTMPSGLNGSTANFIFDDNGGTRTQIFEISNVQLEKKDHATGFASYGTTRTPTIIYDSSGYSNNGTIVGSLTAAAGSPRYDVATVFNGSNTAIKVIDNNWLSQGMKALTINVWIKPAATFTKLFSCTETGGWNTESGNSGYLRFPIHVYTNEAQTTTAYKYDSKELQISAVPLNEWTMLTFIYDGAGTRTYINGELHHTYSNISYGIHYNTNARLFLGCEANTANPTSPYFNGQQSDFRIYTTALTPEQIKELYNTSMSIDSSGNVYARELSEL